MVVLALALLFVLALAIRVSFNLLYDGIPKGDAISLLNYARHIASTGDYPFNRGAYWSPGYVFFLGWLLPGFGEANQLLYFRLFQSLLGSLTCLGFGLYAQRLFGDLAGILTLALLAVYPPLVVYAGMFFSENLFLLLLPPLFYLFHRWQETGNLGYCLGSGILFGLLHLIRPVGMFLPIIFVAWVIITKRKRLKPLMLKELPVFLLVALMAVSPWMLTTYKNYGKPISSNAVGGVNFYIGHNPKANGTWVLIDQDSEVITKAGTPEGNSLGYRMGLEYLISHPQHEWEMLKQKCRWFFSQANMDLYNYKLDQLWFGTFHVPLPPFWPFSILAGLGLIFHWRSWHQWFMPVGFTAYYAALILAMYYAPRYRLIVEPIFIMLAAAALAKPMEQAARYLRLLKV